MEGASVVQGASQNGNGGSRPYWLAAERGIRRLDRGRAAAAQIRRSPPCRPCGPRRSRWEVQPPDEIGQRHFDRLGSCSARRSSFGAGARRPCRARPPPRPAPRRRFATFWAHRTGWRARRSGGCRFSRCGFSGVPSSSADHSFAPSAAVSLAGTTTWSCSLNLACVWLCPSGERLVSSSHCWTIAGHRP